MIVKIKIVVLVIAILLFVISLTQPAYYINRKDYDGWANSFDLLIFGWSGVLYGGAASAWLANPLIILSWLFFFKERGGSVVTSVLALFFSASFLFFDTVISSEKPDYSIITARKAGYWIWLASIAFFFISATITYYVEKNNNKKVEPL